MNVVSRGIRNAFRNITRSASIIVILGLAIGLSLVMVIARQAVSNKINSVNSSVGNTVNITPAGFSSFSSVNNALTTKELAKVAALPHVTALNETLTDRLTTIGSASSPFGSTSSSSSSSTNQTSLTSPVTIKVNQSNGSGPSLFVSGGSSSGFTLPSNFSPPITIIGTNNPLSINGTNLTISSGKAISGTTTADDAMVSTSMASKNNLKVGSTFTAYSQTLTVSAIFNGSSTNIAADDIIVSLPLEQSLSGQSGDVTSAVATIDSLTNLTSATNNIKSTLGSSATVTSSLEEAQATVSPLNNIKTITLYSLIGALIAAIVIIFLIMIMIVRERRREIGVLKAIGASNIKVVVQFMSEAITLTIAGSIIGIIIGVAASSPITHLLVTNETSTTSTQVSPGGPVTRTGGFSGGGGFGGISRGNGNFTIRDVNRGAFGGIRNSLGNVQTVVGWSIVLYGVGAALVIAIIGSTASSLLISKIRPAEVMRVE
jgi:putative ABC transport system permease protein